MTALFIVRAEVRDASVRDAFDRWYEDEHLRDAVAAFEARRAWRGWSRDDARVHLACYEFDSVEAAEAVKDSDALRAMIAEFDRRWGERVTRTREIVSVSQSLPS